MGTDQIGQYLPEDGVGKEGLAQRSIQGCAREIQWQNEKSEWIFDHCEGGFELQELGSMIVVGKPS